MMVKNHIFFYIHLVMIVCSAFGGWQKRMGCVDHMRRMRCPGYSAPQYSVFSCWLALLILCFWFCFIVWLWMLCLVWWLRKKKEDYDALIRKYFRRRLS